MERVRYDDLVATRRLYPGQGVRVRLAGAAAPTADDEPVASNGEVVAPCPSELAMRLWERVPGADAGRPTMLRIEAEHDSALYFVDVGPVEPPSPGETFWAPVPIEWSRVDRRGAYRVEVDLPVRVFAAGSPVPMLRRLVELSAGGCRVEPLAVREGDTVELRFGLLPVATEITMRARVVRHGGIPSRGWTALAFLDFDSADEERVTRFLVDQQRRELAARLGR